VRIASMLDLVHPLPDPGSHERGHVVGIGLGVEQDHQLQSLCTRGCTETTNRIQVGEMPLREGGETYNHVADTLAGRAFRDALKRKASLVRGWCCHGGKARPLNAGDVALPWGWMVPKTRQLRVAAGGDALDDCHPRSTFLPTRRFSEYISCS
jgi:hypothetical protein